MKNLVEHFFRHEYGHLVTVLTQKVGFSHIQEVEDAVQDALLIALESWTQKGVPDNPHAWLYKVAHNNVLGVLRQKNRRIEILEQHQASIETIEHDDLEKALTNEFKDGILNWLFISCHPSIVVESQLIFALKTLCGFSIKEIAIRLFTSEANVYKRYSRARNYLRNNAADVAKLKIIDHSVRLSAVNKVIYLIFTEGYLSSHMQQTIRKEMCDDAIRLCTILIENKVGKNPETHALLALMHLHRARLSARINDSNELLLLEDQDRKLWNQNEIQQGLYWLSKAANGNQFSRYHAEAGIAIEHCLSPSFEHTRWDKIVSCYQLLEKTTGSALHQLNKVVALAQWQGAQAGLTELNKQNIPQWLLDSYQYHAVQSDLNRRCGNRKKAKSFAEKAIQLAPTPAIKKSLNSRLEYE
ncbi:MAG: RNA polymerase sigma factor [Marinicellaceae bacterium]